VYDEDDMTGNRAGAATVNCTVKRAVPRG
jgi:hypothetical protein